VTLRTPFAIEMASPSAVTAFVLRCEGTTIGRTEAETTVVTMVMIGAVGKTESDEASGAETVATAEVTAEAAGTQIGSATIATVVMMTQLGTTRAKKGTSLWTTSEALLMRSEAWTVALREHSVVEK
jgi:hypothetical protein